MPLEIERKFLVKDDSYKTGSTSSLFRQGYLRGSGIGTVRVRITGDKAFLTIKSAAKGAVRQEFEYSIPIEDAQQLLMLCEKPIIEKIRYIVKYEGMIWEVDEFLGENQGLVVAEIELSAEDQSFQTPDWIGEEVTAIPRYYNSSLVHHPFKNW